MTSPSPLSIDPYTRSYRTIGPLPTGLRLSLHDLRADLSHSRRQSDLGRLALLCYCEVRHWARRAGEASLAEHCAALVTQLPSDRDAFLRQIDSVMSELEEVYLRRSSPSRC